jgi:Asp-tRNA(Asn)/Glu-tRNA(Gln) amidotransferase B subunit
MSYGGIRSGIDYLRHDGKTAATWINTQVRDVLDVPITTVIARRSRTPDPTQLLKLFEMVESGTMSPEEATHRARELLREFGESEQTIRQLVGQVDREFQKARKSTHTLMSRAQ